MRIRRAAASYRAALLAAAAARSRHAATAAAAASRAPHPPPLLRVQRVFPALSFTQPVAMLQAPGDAARWFVVEQAGVVRVFANTPQVATSSIFADITGRVTVGGEMGLLGMAFHPDFPTNPRVYLSYTERDRAGPLLAHLRVHAGRERQFPSRLGNGAACASASPRPTTTAARSLSARTGCCTSASATAAARTTSTARSATAS